MKSRSKRFCNPYPEHEKLKKIQPFSQKVGEFLDWLRQEKHIELATWQDDRLWPIHTSTLDLLAGFFDIDQSKLEKEKREMLDLLRSGG